MITQEETTTQNWHDTTDKRMWTDYEKQFLTIMYTIFMSYQRKHDRYGYFVL